MPTQDGILRKGGRWGKERMTSGLPMMVATVLEASMLVAGRAEAACGRGGPCRRRTAADLGVAGQTPPPAPCGEEAGWLLYRCERVTMEKEATSQLDVVDGEAAVAAPLPCSRRVLWYISNSVAPPVALPGRSIAVVAGRD